MVVTTTAVAFISLSLGLTFCGLWFLKAFRKADGIGGDKKIGFLITSIFLLFGFNNGIMGVGALLFANNSEALYFVLIASHFFLVPIAILGVYASHYIFSPRVSPYFALALTGILGITCVVVTVVSHPKPFISLQNGIEWGYNFSLSLLVFYILFISIGSTVYIFGRLFLTTKTRQLKIISLILSILGLVGILLNFIRFVLFYNANTSVNMGIYDFGIVFIGIVFIVVLAIAPIIQNLIRSRKQKAVDL